MVNREQRASFALRLQASRARLAQVSGADLAAAILPALLLLALVLAAIVYFLRPLPPRTMTIGTGSLKGSYGQYALRYRSVFERAGIKLQIVPTPGASDSLGMLSGQGTGGPPLDAAILQDGLADANTPGVLSVGAIGYEPIWVFYRSKETWDRLSDLAGKVVNIGRWSAGTQPFAIELLREAHLDEDRSGAAEARPNIQIATLSGTDALPALLAGRIDAVITLGETDSTTVQAYFHAAGVKAMDLAQAVAISRKRPFLHRVIIPRGGIDLEHDLPAADLQTVATTSVVYVREDLHPALVTLLASAMREVHQSSTLLNAKHEFPSDQDESVPLHPVAERYMRNGPPFLMRFLPFWLATLIDRTFVLLVPLLALLIPVSRVIPQIYQWRIRARLDRWYGELKILEGELDRTEGELDRGLLLDRAQWIEGQLARLKLPLSFSNQLYILKEHVELVRRRVLRNTRERPIANAPEPIELAD